ALGWRDGWILAGERSVESDLLADDFSEALDPLTDLVLSHTGEVEAHRGPASPIQERGPTGHERDVLVQGAREQIGRVDVVRQRRPDEQPALGMGPFRLAREMLGQRVKHHVAAAAVDL